MSFSELHRLNSMSLGEAALAYAMLGLKVFPLWGVHWDDMTRMWECDCGAVHASPKDKGKHPWVRWSVLATSDPEQITRWWQEKPNANIGIACKPSGLLVLDLDGKEDPGGGYRDGRDVLNAWLDDRELTLPETIEAVTGSGGAHLFFRDPGGIVDNGWLYLVDVKGAGKKVDGAGGYVVAAPSRHGSGELYRWKTAAEQIAMLPEMMIAELRAARPRRDEGGGHDGGSAQHTLPRGYNYETFLRDGPRHPGRDEFFNDHAYRRRQHGWTRAAVEVEIRELWARTEQPEGDLFSLDKALEKVENVWRDVPAPAIPEGGAEQAVRWAQAQSRVRETTGPAVRGHLALVQDEEPEMAPVTGDPQIERPFLLIEQLTETGGAIRLAERCRDRYIYVPGLGWHVWDGAIWAPDEDAAGIYRLLDEIILDDAAWSAEHGGDQDLQDAHVRFRVLLQGLSLRKRAVEFASKQDHVTTDHEILDTLDHVFELHDDDVVTELNPC